MIFALALRAAPAAVPARPGWPRPALAGVLFATAHLLGRIGRRPREAAGARPAGFEELVLRHLDSAYSLARFLSRDGDAAEDIVQTAVLEAHRGFGGYRGGDAKAWLLTIVRREYMHWSARRRAGAARMADADISELADRIPSESATPEQALLQGGEIARIRAAIDALPEPFRESIVLRELEELSYREVAEVTGVPIGTVMSRLARGREMLAKRLLGDELRSEAAS